MIDTAVFTWSALAVPIVSGAFTALTTAAIVFGANRLTRNSIEASNKKSLDELKVNFENSRELQLDIERMRIDAKEQADWETELIKNIADYEGQMAVFEMVTRDWANCLYKNIELKLGDDQDEDFVDGKRWLKEREHQSVMKMTCAYSKIISRLSKDVDEHYRLIETLDRRYKMICEQRVKVNTGEGYVELAEEKGFYVTVQEALNTGKCTVLSSHS